MLIDSIRLHNFRAFHETHKIDLSTSKSANLVVVHGENMRGKTTLLQAIRWGLYGEVADRDNRFVPVLDPLEREQLLSLDAASDGDYSIWVEINFHHEGGDYQLRRQAKASGQPSTDEDFDCEVSLSRNETHYAEGRIASEIESILSREVSRFFLFDGEMLQDYERLLKNPDEEALAVKDSIEKILGVPALRAFEDLALEAIRDEKRLNLFLKKREKHSNLVEEVTRLDNEIKSHKRDLEVLQRDLMQLRADQAEAELAVQHTRAYEKQLTEKRLFEDQVDEADEKVEEHARVIRDLLRETWWLPVSGVIDDRLATLRSEIEAGTKRIQASTRLADLERSNKNGVCELCGSKLDHHGCDAIREKLTQLKLKNFGIEPVELLELMKREKLYEQFRSPEVVSEILVRQQEMDSAVVTRADLQARIQRIDNEMRGRIKGDPQAKLERSNQLGGQVKSLEIRVQELDKRLNEQIAKHEAKQRQLSSLPDADPKLKLQVQTYRTLEGVFKSAMVTFRDQARAIVEADASDIFKQLTTEKAYSGLRINETYGLALLDHDGNPVPGRSTGAEQIVALSLIGGLNKAAVREGPVVMDTNFGRLDRPHRLNVLRFLPELGPQVIILVHSGELPKEQELSDLGVKVARRYEVRRVSETRSEIEELS